MIGLGKSKIHAQFEIDRSAIVEITNGNPKSVELTEATFVKLYATKINGRLFN